MKPHTHVAHRVCGGWKGEGRERGVECGCRGLLQLKEPSAGSGGTRPSVRSTMMLVPFQYYPTPSVYKPIHNNITDVQDDMQSWRKDGCCAVVWALQTPTLHTPTGAPFRN